MKKINLFIFIVMTMCLTAFSQNNVLVIDYNNAFSSDQSNNASNIYNRLLATQASVVRVNVIPATINPATYDQVWIFGNMGTPSPATLNPISTYMNAGGAVYIQSEVGCCTNEAAFVDQLINATVTAGGAITHSTIKSGNYEFEPNPSLVCTPWNHRGGAARIFTGVPVNNRLFIANNTCGVAGAPTTGDVVGVSFASCDMISGQGALVVVGDLNLFVLNTACAQPLLLNTPNNNNFLIIDFIANLFPSLVVCGSQNPTSAAISYAPYSYCSTDPNPTPTIIGNTGGTITVDNGGVINTSTGEINLASSGIGTFNVTYTTGGTCPDTNTVSITINNCSSICDTLCGPNLAPNPGFENTTLNCADTVSEVFTDYSQVQGWYGTACSTCPGNGSTPDYYNSLCNGPAQTNNCGTSNGSMGFFTYAIAGANAREYVQAQLASPLVAGTEYCISIDVKTSNESFAYKPSDGFGLWFTNQMVDIDVQNGGQMYIGPGSLINATPQIENPSGNFIDTICQTITGTFTATGTEQWVVIGNFRNDVNTQFSTTCSFFNPCFGYLIVDDISIRTSCNNIPLPLDLQLSLMNDTICEGSCTDLTASVTGGTAPYTITWDNSLPNGTGPHNVCPTTTTTYTAIVTDSLNQSDTATITLYVNSIDSTTLNTTICSGDSVFVGGNWQTTTGTYYDTLQNVLGCDSIHQTVLNVNPTPSTTQNISLCQGDSIIVGSNTYNSSGNYIDTLINAATNGCDSIVTTNLTVSSVVTSSSTATICQGDSILLGGTYQTTSGIYNDTIIGGSSSGCDSVITTTLTVNPIITNSTTATICQGDSILLGGGYQTTSGNYNDTIVGGSSTGCDSIISTILTVNPVATGIDVITSCSPITWIDGNNYATSTSTPTDTLFGGAANGCDSIVTLNLTITSPTSITNVLSECEGFSITVGTNTYNTTGIYTDILNGCDTVITDLTINPAPTLSLTKVDDNCGEKIGSVSAITSSNNPPIVYSWNTGSTDSTINNLPVGTYTITINDGSGCSNADTIDVLDFEIGCEYFVYTPNVFTPNGDGNNDIFFVRGKGIATMNIKIYNRWGNKVFESSDINQGWDGKHKGSDQNTAVFVYILQVTFENGKTIEESGDIGLIR